MFTRRRVLRVLRPPPPGSGIERQQALHAQGKGAPDAERIELGREINRIMVREAYVICTVGVSPALMGVRVKRRGLENVPEIAPFSTPAQTPGPVRPEQWFFSDA